MLKDLLLCRADEREKNLSAKFQMAQAHAEELEEDLLVVDPREAYDQIIHSKVCYERQVAAHAWRKANNLQNQLNSVQSERQFRCLITWGFCCFGIVGLHDLGLLPQIPDLVKMLLKVMV